MNIIIDLLSKDWDVLPKDLPPNTLILGKFPEGWFPTTYLGALGTLEWLIQKIIAWMLAEEQLLIYPWKLLNVTIFIPQNALGFGIALGVSQRMKIQPSIIVQSGNELVDLTDFTETRNQFALRNIQEINYEKTN